MDKRSENLGVDDRACQHCGGPSMVWFAPNELWNFVLGGPEALDDPGGVLCPTCFLVQCESNPATAGLVWRLEPTTADHGVADARKRERRRLADLLEEHAASIGAFACDTEATVRLVALLLRLNHEEADRG